MEYSNRLLHIVCYSSVTAILDRWKFVKKDKTPFKLMQHRFRLYMKFGEILKILEWTQCWPPLQCTYTPMRFVYYEISANEVGQILRMQFCSLWPSYDNSHQSFFCQNFTIFVNENYCITPNSHAEGHLHFYCVHWSSKKTEQ